MAEIHIQRPTLSAIVSRFLVRLLRGAVRREPSGDAHLGRLQHGKETFRAIARLTDDQLRDIGVYRKPRRVRSDYLGRDVRPGSHVDFDYYRIDG